MASKKATAATEAVETNEAVNSSASEAKAENEAITAATAAKKAPTYTVDELANAAGKAFGKAYSPDLVRAAFMVAGKKEATKEEAEAIVKAFAERKVK